MGFGLDHEVKQALRKLAALKPEYRGKYSLPVAFTYANAREKKDPYVPVNVLPSNRMSGRTLLSEWVIPIVVSKPISTSREVWGYYK